MDSKSPSKMLVKELREELEHRRLSSKGLKAELVSRLEQAIAEEKKANSSNTEKAQDDSIQKSDIEKEASIQKEGNSGNGPEEHDRKDTNLDSKDPEKGVHSPKGEKSMQIEGKKRTLEEEAKSAESDSTKRKRGSTETESVVSTGTPKTILPEQKDNAEQEEKKGMKKEFKTTEAPAKREVSPSMKPHSRALFIKNFVRPFTLSSVKSLLETYGTIADSDWGMDEVKSKCYVFYNSIEEAVRAREEIHHLVWPPANKTKLDADFCTEEEAKKFLSERLGLSARTKDTPAKKTLSLDELFFKTTTKPFIYFLPLTDKEVAAKKAKEANNGTNEKTSQIRN